MRTALQVGVVSVALLFATAAPAQVAVCGNGVLEAPEQCDDGNTTPGDCCSALCLNENLPPDCSAAVPSVGELWPPNHKMIAVTIAGVTDPDGDPLSVSATAIAQDEPLDAAGDGATCPDALGVGLDTVQLRAERSGPGDGRFYHVAFAAVDRCSAACTGEVTVVVPHDQSPKKTPGDGGPLYDATRGAPPCQGDACDPTDCVPDPDDVEGCHGVAVPAPVLARIEKAKRLLAHAQKGRRAGRAAARQLAKAAKGTARAARHGAVPPACEAALATALEDGGACAVCLGTGQ